MYKVIVTSNTKMGKTYSKQEEIIIAQNGTNNASQTSLEQKVELYGIALASLLVFLFCCFVFLYPCILFMFPVQEVSLWSNKMGSQRIGFGSVLESGAQNRSTTCKCPICVNGNCQEYVQV